MTRAIIGPCPETRGQVAQRKPSTIRGELAIGRGSSRHNLAFGRPTGSLTMMQSCASAAKLRGGGPILENGVKPWPVSGDRPLGSSSETDDILFVRLRGLCPVCVLLSRRSQDDASRYLAG